MVTKLSSQVFGTQGLIQELRVIDPQRFRIEPLAAGTPGAPVRVDPVQFQNLLRAAATEAAGGQGRFPGAVIWQHAGSRLYIGPGVLRTTLADGVIAISLPVYCDQLAATPSLVSSAAAAAEVHVSFFVGSPRRAAGLLATTEERPRGPAIVVDLWGERIVALLWQSLLGLLQSLAAESGRDEDGAPLLPADLVASANGIVVRPLARHAFDRVA